MSLEEVVVGAVGKAHGLRGDVAIDVRTDEPERRFADGAVLRAEGGARGTLTIASTRWHSGRLLARFVEANDRTAVEQLRGVVLVVDVPSDEVPEDEDEYYDRQIIGLDVLAADGTRVGEVTEVIHLPVQDTLVVRTTDGERLIPFVAALVPDVDLKAGTCTLADVRGLMDDEAEVAGPDAPVGGAAEVQA